MQLSKNELLLGCGLGEKKALLFGGQGAEQALLIVQGEGRGQCLLERQGQEMWLKDGLCGCFGFGCLVR